FDHRLGIPVDHVEQNQRGPPGSAVATFPVPQGCGREAELGGELFLGHAHLGTHGLDIDLAGAMHAHAMNIALGVSDRFRQALPNVVECSAQDFARPFQMFTNTSTRPASSLRSALVRLALSPLAKSASRYSGM